MTDLDIDLIVFNIILDGLAGHGRGKKARKGWESSRILNWLKSLNLIRNAALFYERCAKIKNIFDDLFLVKKNTWY